MKTAKLLTTAVRGGSDTTAPTVVISATGATSNVVAVQIVFSEVVTGFVVGDIIISAGGSLASFATADNKTFTVSWTLAAGANTMDIAAGVCTDAAGNLNTAATQYNAGYLTLQPDSTADIDTVLRAGDSANYSTANNVWLGYISGAVRRLLIKFDLTSVPTFATISSAVLTLNQEAENSTNARRISLYKLLRDWVLTQANASVYSTGNAWQTAMADGALDRGQTEFAGRDVTATEANGAKTFTLPATTKADFGAYGWLVKLSDETADAYLLSTCNSTTAGNRPKLVVIYYINP